MGRIIFVPQYPTAMRYQEWWIWKFEMEFQNAGYEVHTLGKKKASEMISKRGDLEMFSPIDSAIELECYQIDEFMKMDVDESDILFLADISFPGIFSNVLFHKRTEKMFAFCHATSLNFQDYFSKYTPLKFPIETSHSKLFKKVFVGSQYHKDKLGWENTVVTYLPYPPYVTINSTPEEKQYNIISASRPTPQKVDLDLERQVEWRYSKVIRKNVSSWKTYHDFLRESKVLLITSREDTFGYQIVDAIINGCIPIAPNRCAYPELLPQEYLYNSEAELFRLLDICLQGAMKVPVLKCSNKMQNFYNRIVKEIEKW